jgi:hypothetical protein
MKRVIQLIVLTAALAVCLCAATHSITIAWTDTVNPTGTTTYNVYRLTGACPTPAPATAPPPGFAQLVSGISTTTETDSTVLPATTYCYLVTAVVAGSESVPSNTAQGVEPGSFPPTMLQVKSIE